MSKFAWVTLATNDSYSLGALVLAYSLKRVNTAHQLAILITPTVSESMRNKLKDVFNVVQEVNVLDSQDAANLALLARPELGITFTKIHCWRLVQFEKCVFLDADTLVLQNCDELFEREELSAAPDVGWPDCFNSGVFVFRPNLDTFAKITQFALDKGSFDGGDQGLLNLYFADWATKDIAKHLPFSYNTCSTATYSYLPAFKQFADRIKILHFIGQMKPWLLNFNSQTKTVYTPQEYGHLHLFLQFWWDIFCDNIHPSLNEDMNYKSHPNEIFASTQNQNQYNTIERDEIHTEVIFNIIIRDPWEDYYENLDKVSNSTYTEPYYDNSINDNQRNSNTNTNHNQDNSKNNNSDEIVQSFENNSGMQSPTIDRSFETHMHHHYHHHQQQPQETAQSDNNFNVSYSPVGENVPCDNTASSVVDKKHESSGQQHVEQPPREENVYYSDKSVVSEQNYHEPLSSSNQSENIKHAQVIATSNDSRDLDNANNNVAGPENEAGIAGALSKLRLGEARTPEQDAYEQHIRRQCWESGNIDYTGRDSFDNIWARISQTMNSGPKPEPKPEPKPKEPKNESGTRLTSADIQDGKVEIDKKTGVKTTYKLIEKGFEKIIETPQPNGTMKTETQTFYDPQPLTAEELEAANKPEGTYKKGNVTTVVKNIPGGKQLTIITTNKDGTQTVQTQTVYEAQEEEITETTSTESSAPKKKTTTVVAKKVPGGTAFDDESNKKTSKKVVSSQDSTTTEEVKVKSQRTVEETRRVTETTEITGKSTKTTKKNTAIEQQNVQAIEDKKEKKEKKLKKCPLPPDFVEKEGETTTLEKRKVQGGTEYVYTTILTDGRIQISRKIVEEEQGVDMDDEEIEEYRRQLQEAEKYKNIKKTKKIHTESGTKTVVPSENPGEVTTMETIKIEGGTEYHYTTIRPDGTMKKSTKTVYDRVAVEGSEEEFEEVEEYEEEIIEPGEPIVETIETIKTITPEEKKKLEQDVPASNGSAAPKKKGKKSAAK